MRCRFQFSGEKLLCAVAAVALVASVGWNWHQAGRFRRLRSVPVGLRLSPGHLAIENLEPVETTVKAWARPAPAPDGWDYDVFTPPEIYYDGTARKFSVKPPPPGDLEAGDPGGPELLAVKAQPYRLQLAGYFGHPGDNIGAFISRDGRDSILAKPGQRIADLGLVLRSLEVKQTPAPDLRLVAEAVVHDEVTGTDVTLDSRERKFTDSPIAVIKAKPSDRAPLELHLGDTFASGGATYRVERIQLDPPEVLVSPHVSGLPETGMRVLRPPPSAVARSDNPSPRLATGPLAASIASVAK